MRILLALVVIALAGPSYGQVVYGEVVKCVGKDGRVEYSTDCPPDTTEHKTRLKSSTDGTATASPPPAQKSLANRDAESKLRAIEQQKEQQNRADKAAEANVKSVNCQLAKAFVRDLESGIRMTRTDPQTLERVYLDDAEREAELEKARARIAQNCE